MQYVVLGGSIAAASAVSAIRKKDREAEVTVVAPETPFYYRPLIPMLVDGSRSVDDISYSGEVEGIARLVKDRAVGLDTKAREVSLGSGGRLGYDRLLIATGSSPLIPDIPGGEKLRPMRTASDALALKDAAAGAKEALVVGGGLVGIKTALALGKLGLKATIVEKLGQVLHPRLDARGASILEGRLRQSGIEIMTGEMVSEASGGKAKLASGRELSAPLIAVAVGTSPNIGWLNGSGLRADAGLSVDKTLMTSAEGVYAAGDAVCFADAVTGMTVRSALWAHAVEMGRIAGTNMAGGRTVCPDILQVLNATEIEGIPMVSVGRTEAEPDAEVYAHEGSKGYRKLIFDGARLTGALFMGDIRGSGVYAHLIRNRTQLSDMQKRKAINATLGYADFALAGMS